VTLDRSYPICSHYCEAHLNCLPTDVFHICASKAGIMEMNTLPVALILWLTCLDVLGDMLMVSFNLEAIKQPIHPLYTCLHPKEILYTP
jgi:hypothetical protein